MNQDLIDKSIFILREAFAQFKKVAILWSTGKDSTTLLHLCKQAFFGTIPFPVIHLDTGKKFPEIIKFRDELTKEWNLDLIVAKPEEYASPEHNGHFNCCTTLKTNTLKAVLKEHGFDALLLSIRRDEHYMRNIERFFSPRNSNFEYQFVRPKTELEIGDAPFESLQDTELSGWNLYASSYHDCHHVRVHPILHWCEDDVWTYVKENELPINPLYFKGYRSLGCMPCTNPVWNESPKNVDDIITYVKNSREGERAGRAQDKESEQVMRKLRSLGYC